MKKLSILLAFIITLITLGSSCEADFAALQYNSSSTNPNLQSSIKPTSKWSLWSGKTKMRGANIYQRRVYKNLDGDSFGPGPVGPTYTQKDFNNLAELGANWVQIEHPGLYSEKPPYKLDIGMQTNLDNLLAMAKKANLFVTIGFRTGPGRSEFTFYDENDADWFPKSYRNDNVWKKQTAQTAWADMWKYTANRYKNKQNIVGYNLMIEPNGESRAFKNELWEPGEFYPKHKNNLADWNQMYPKLVTSIRQTDKITPILVGHMAYNSIDWLPYLNNVSDPYIVFIAHQYEPYNYTHDGKKNTKYPGNFSSYGEKINLNKNYLENKLNKAKNTANKNNRPLAIDEYGVYRHKNGADKFLDDSLSLMESKNINHAIWVWDSAERIKNFPNDDQFNFTHGTNKKNHKYISNNLLDIIKKYWAKNTMRPY